MNDAKKDLDQRSRAIFQKIVETYLSTGEPVGSRNLSRQLPIKLSPASVRNIMSDLEALNLIYSPHTSAGRLPTESGLRLSAAAFDQTGSFCMRRDRALYAYPSQLIRATFRWPHKFSF